MSLLLIFLDFVVVFFFILCFLLFSFSISNKTYHFLHLKENSISKLLKYTIDFFMQTFFFFTIYMTLLSYTIYIFFMRRKAISNKK